MGKKNKTAQPIVLNIYFVKETVDPLDAALANDEQAEGIKAFLSEQEKAEQAKADIAQMGQESMAEWLMREISDILLLGGMPSDLAMQFTKEIGGTIFRNDGTGEPVLKFGGETDNKDKPPSDRSTTTDEVPGTTDLEFALAEPEMGTVTPGRPADDHVKVTLFEGPAEAVARTLMYL